MSRYSGVKYAIMMHPKVRYNALAARPETTAREVNGMPVHNDLLTSLTPIKLPTLQPQITRKVEDIFYYSIINLDLFPSTVNHPVENLHPQLSFTLLQYTSTVTIKWPAHGNRY